MVNETLLYAAAGLAVTETTGITNFTGSGGGGGGGVGRPQVPGLGNIRFPDLPQPQAPNVSGFADAQARMAEAFAGMQQTALEVPTAGDAPQVTNPFEDFRIEVPTPEVPDVPGGGGGGGGGGGSGGSGGNLGDGDFQLQDLAFTGPLGTTAAVIGESGVAAGETVGGVAEFVGTPGRGSGGVFGGIYDAGRATGEAARSTRDAIPDAPDVSGPNIDAATAFNLATPFNTQGLPDIPSPVGTAAADSSRRIRNTGGADPSGGTPSVREVERVAAERSEEKKERLKEIQSGGSTGARLI